MVNVLLWGGLILNPSQEVEFERSLSNHNLNQGNKFKFIEMNDAIESHRGVRLEDGLIRVEFKFEYAMSYIIYPHGMRSISVNPNIQPAYVPPTYTTCCSVNVGNTGITVPGSMSNQSFNYGDIGTLENISHSMIFRLMGKTDNSIVTKTVTVKSKPRCVTCNRLNKSSSKYCSSCGTSLVIYS